MKQYIYSSVFILLFHTSVMSQEADLSDSSQLLWKSAIENVVFDAITDIDTDSTGFIETFLVFYLEEQKQSEVLVFLMMGWEML